MTIRTVSEHPTFNPGFPVFFYEEGMQLPREGNYFVVAGNGQWMHKDTGIVRAFIPVDQISVLPDLDATSGISCNIPPLPIQFVYQIQAFFKDVVAKYHSEATVTLFFNPQNQTYKIDIPKQTVSHGSVNYQNRTAEDLGWEGFFRVGSIHSHCDFGAYHSHVDVNDEVGFDGLHCTFGNNDQESFSITASIVVNGFRSQVDPKRYLSGIQDFTPPAPGKIAKLFFGSDLEKKDLFTLKIEKEDRDKWDQERATWINQVEPKPVFQFGRPARESRFFDPMKNEERSLIREPRVYTGDTFEVGEIAGWKKLYPKLIEKYGQGPFEVIERKEDKIGIKTENGDVFLSRILFKKEEVIK